MKIETTPREDHQLEMLVDVEPEKMEAARRRAARKIAEKGKIPGFRPGKAPYDVVRRAYGDAAINEEAIEILVDEIYPAALQQANIEPAAAGALEDVVSLDPPQLKFRVPLMPSVELGEYRAVRQEYAWQPPAESEIDEQVENLRRMYGKTETVERAAEKDDYLSVDIVARQAKAKEGDEPLLERKGYALVVGREEKDDEFPFPGFGKKVIGLKPGESVTISHKFPKDFSDEKFAGKTVSFELTARTVRAVSLPELNDEFAQKTGLGQTVEEFRARLRENIEGESRNEYDDKFFSKLIDQIKAGATIKYPPQVLEHELEHVIEDIKHRLAEQGADFETYLKIRETTLEKFTEDEARPVAVKRLERGLIMDEIARVEGLRPTDEAMQQEFQQMWASLAANDQEFARMTKNGTRASQELINAVASDAAGRLTTRLVLDRLKEIATGQAPALEAAAQPAAEAAPAEAEAKPKKKKAAKKAAPAE
ncbi:MAG: trigger factor [Anaerolineales bacterium]